MAAQNLLQPVLISVFAVLFGDYFVALFPALEGYKTLISIVILLIYIGNRMGRASYLCVCQ